MEFENFEPNSEMPTDEQNEEKREEDAGEEVSVQESLEGAPTETEEDAPEPEEKTNDELAGELWPPREETKEEKTGPSWGKAAIAATALAGTLAGNAYAGTPEQFSAEPKNEITVSHENKASSQEMELKKNEAYNRMLERFREKLQKKDDFSGIKDGYTRRGKEARAARERAWMQTVIDHPEKVHTTIDAEKGTVFFVGTYTDPDSGAEQPFEQIYQLIKK